MKIRPFRKHSFNKTVVGKTRVNLALGVEHCKRGLYFSPSSQFTHRTLHLLRILPEHYPRLSKVERIPPSDVQVPHSLER
jgi:hypothetical protein